MPVTWRRFARSARNHRSGHSPVDRCDPDHVGPCPGVAAARQFGVSNFGAQDEYAWVSAVVRNDSDDSGATVIVNSTCWTRPAPSSPAPARPRRSPVPVSCSRWARRRAAGRVVSDVTRGDCAGRVPGHRPHRAVCRIAGRPGHRGQGRTRRLRRIGGPEQPDSRAAERPADRRHLPERSWRDHRRVQHLLTWYHRMVR